MTKKFNVEEFERTEMKMDAKLETKDETNPHRSDDAAPTHCRRAGFDRRWIPSKNHRPERRRGGDRRVVQKRSFSEPLVPDAPGQTDYLAAGSEALESESPAAESNENWAPEALESRDNQVLPESR
jgi:hypothetical protein